MPAASAAHLIDRWVQYRHLWKVFGSLEEFTFATHHILMECCNGKSLFLLREYDVLFLEVKREVAQGRKENGPVFLIKFRGSTRATILEESEWVWDESQLKLCYNVLADIWPTVQPRHDEGATEEWEKQLFVPQSLEIGWVPQSLGIGWAPEDYRGCSPIAGAIFVPGNYDLLHEDPGKLQRERDLWTLNENAASWKFLGVDMTIAPAGGWVTSGSKGGYDSWWPSWYL